MKYNSHEIRCLYSVYYDVWRMDFKLFIKVTGFSRLYSVPGERSARINRESRINFPFLSRDDLVICESTLSYSEARWSFSRARRGKGSDILNMLPASFRKLRHEDAAGGREIMFRRVSNLKASSLDRPLNHYLQTASTISPHLFATRRSGCCNARVYKWPHSSRCQRQPPAAFAPSLASHSVPFLSRFWGRKCRIPFHLSETIDFPRETIAYVALSLIQTHSCTFYCSYTISSIRNNLGSVNSLKS